MCINWQTIKRKELAYPSIIRFFCNWIGQIYFYPIKYIDIMCDHM